MSKTSPARQAPQDAPPENPESIGQSSEIILLAVTGMSPAILTETIWALARGNEPVIPDRILVVTTAEGRKELERQLFTPQPPLGGRCPWDSLRESLATDGHTLAGKLRFGTTADDVRVITAMDPSTGLSHELPDLRTPADNEAAANFLLETVRAIVENPDTRLIGSLAGGRKTMGALLYACMTLVGRETDRLTHVLVSEPFETLRGFWFPGQPGGAVLDRAGTAHEPATARVDLADVPFVPLRNLFERELGRKAGTFSRLVDTCRAGIRRHTAERLKLSLDPARAELEVNGQMFKLAPTEMLLALFLSRRAKHNEPAYVAYKDSLDDFNAFRTELLEGKRDFNDWRHADSLRSDWEERDITRANANLREKLRRASGDGALLASCLPEKGRCSLDVPGPMIHIKA